MQKGFVKGVIVGGIIATSVGMIMNSGMSGSKRRIMRNSRSFLRKTGNIINDVVDLIR